MDNTTNTKNISLDKIWKSEEQGEGDGARVVRLISGSNNIDTDPFLMFDYYNARLPGGFPDHPHRGFETITYQLEGEMWHEDFKGHKGKILPGGVQWMTAGKAIVHAEMPGSWTESAIGFQLWINLSKENKMIEPAYQEFSKDQIPIYTDPTTKSTVKVICGDFNDIKGPCQSKTPACYYDVGLNEDAEFNLPIGEDKNGYLFVYQGSITIDGKEIKTNYAGRFSPGKGNILNVKCNKGGCGKFILMAAKPLKEPIKQMGPFVMNTEKELIQAYQDYQDSKNGFEGADTWNSEIKNMKYKKK